MHAAPSQEAAAEVLDLPFSTYRRHLAKAVDELTDVLWSVEIGELRLPPTDDRRQLDRGVAPIEQPGDLVGEQSGRPTMRSPRRGFTSKR